jgi:hypothetical protein
LERVARDVTAHYENEPRITVGRYLNGRVGACMDQDRMQPRMLLLPHHPPALCSDSWTPAAVIEDLFEANDWEDTWRDSIY